MRRSVRLIFHAAMVATLCVSDAMALPAFPGAAGYGQSAAGGRGGRVIYVTNLNNSGIGSLREACQVATGPRIVVFRVAGTILISSRINISSPYITIAGETAPGGGIQIKTNGYTGDNAALWITTSDVVIRHLRIRTAQGSNGLTGDTWEYWVDPITLWTGASNVMLDHLSTCWGSKDEIRVWNQSPAPHDITIQNCILAEGLKSNGHKGSLAGGGTTRLSYIRNLFAHNAGRNPYVKGDEDDGSVVAMFQVVNNVVYNWGSEGLKFGQAPSTTRLNLVGNYYKRGPNTPPVANFTEIQVYQSNGTLTKAYVRGNISPLRTADNMDEWSNVGMYTYPNSGIFPQAPREYQSTTPFDMPAFRTLSAFQAYDTVLATVGATRPMRDTVDRRVVSDVRDGTGRIIDVPEDVGGWPTLASGTPYVDADADGIADAWESSHGGSLDANGTTVDATGRYTNIECFLQELAGDTVYSAGGTRAGETRVARPGASGANLSVPKVRIDGRLMGDVVPERARPCTVRQR